MPEKDLYYGFVMNNSSHFMEIMIWSVQKNKQMYRNIVLPPAVSKDVDNEKSFEYWDKTTNAFRSANVFSLWLHLGTYKISIRQRDDVIDQRLAGAWKTYIVPLDKKYIEQSPGPFTFEIEDD